jgi:hypothetical protein
MSRLVVALLLLTSPALGAPPPPGSEDAQVMGPYKDWITSQHDGAGRWCCDIGDGRPVEARTQGNHWQAHITPDHFPGETDRWQDIPDERIVKSGNPTGVAILWMYQGRVQCFAVPSGV